MHKIAVMGDKASVLGFKALGLDVFPCDFTGAGKILHSLSEENYAIVYITEQLATYIQSDIEAYKESITPAIILIPSKDGSLGIGMNNVKKCVERAVGADILES